MATDKSAAPANAQPVPRLEDFPEYVEARDRLIKLKAKSEAALDRADDIGRLLQEPKDHVADRAKILAETGELVPDVRPALQQELERLQPAIQVMAQAIAIQEDALAGLRSKVSQQVCEQLRGRHQDLVKKIASALWKLGECDQAELQLREALADGGITINLPGLISPAGDRRQLESPLCKWFWEAAAQGYLPANDPSLNTLKIAFGRQ